MTDQSNSDYICIVCKKPLNQEFKQDQHTNYQPDSGVGFTGAGHYGSSFDLSRELHITVCDDCLKKAVTQGMVHIAEKPKPQPAIYRKVSSFDETHDSTRDW